MADVEVQLRGIVKTFGATRAVDRLDLDIERGEFFAVLGPSGCGKTTTLRLIAGLEEPTEGDVYIRSARVTALPPYKRNIGMVFQDYALFPHMTIFENIAFGLRMRGWAREGRRIEARVRELLDLIQLPDIEKRLPRQLSGGQRQRVALARALAPEPAVLLLDEPLSNLDLKLRQELRLEIRRIQKQLGITTIFVTHDQGEALSLADRLMVMMEGRAVQQGVPAAVYEHPRTRWLATFLGDANIFTGGMEWDDEAQGLLVTDTGLRFLMPAEVGKSVAGRKPAIAAIRPEAVQLLPLKMNAAGEGTLTVGIVDAVSYVGSGARYVVRFEGRASDAVYVDVAPANLSWTRGTRLRMLFPREKWVILEE